MRSNCVPIPSDCDGYHWIFHDCGEGCKPIVRFWNALHGWHNDDTASFDSAETLVENGYVWIASCPTPEGYPSYVKDKPFADAHWPIRQVLRFGVKYNLSWWAMETFAYLWGAFGFIGLFIILMKLNGYNP